MANIIDYIKWRGDLDFKISRFNEIDSLILNRFSYLPLDSIMEESEKLTIFELSQRFDKADKSKLKILLNNDIELFLRLGKSERFNKIIVSGYSGNTDEEAEKQFFATTLILPDSTIYISFRGTDNTIIGWKEDFNMSFKSHIASQISAREYVESVSKKYPLKKIRIGGHSKGGNLAVYAGIFSNNKVKKKVIGIYNNDGPGFREDIVNTSEYKSEIKKVITYIPQSSVIGMLLKHEEEYKIIESTSKGLMQHDLYSWQLLGDKFIIVKEITKESKFIDKTITSWLDGLDIKTREQVIDIIFEIVSTTEVRTVNELKLSILKNAKIILSSYKQIEPENKKMITETIAVLLEIIRENFKEEYMKNSMK